MNRELDDALEEAFETSAVPGIGVGIAHRGVTYIRGFGLANLETNEAVTEASAYPIHSITKPYTATAMMGLVERGTVGLDEPVLRYLPGFQVRDASATAGVRVRDLLAHTSGWVGDPFDLGNLGDLAGDLGLAVEAMRDTPQITPVGLIWSYSNSSYVVAGRLIEAVTGLAFEDAMRSLVLDPLGLQATSYEVDDITDSSLVAGHEASEDGIFATIPPVRPTRIEAPGGGLISTLEDQLRWLRWWSSDGDDANVLAARSRAMMIAPQVPAGGLYDAMGLGWGLLDLCPGTALLSVGSGRGLQTMAICIPSHEFALAVFVNADSGYAVGQTVAKLALRHWLDIALPERRPTEPPPTDSAAFLGSYRWPGEGRIRVVGDAHQLTIEALGPDDGVQFALPASVSRTDELVITGGPYSGTRAELVRVDGEVFGLRVMGRVCPTEHVDE